jgi:regulator of sigma E protease
VSIAYIALAIVALGFLIVVHEAGHYFVARWCGMRVDRFSIGFGPGILKRRSKKTGTIFQLAPIPFGGFVEIRGMNIAEDVDPDDKQAYPNRPAWQRFVTIFAGPATNYLSAIALGIALFTCHGVESKEPTIHVAAVLTDTDASGKPFDAVGKLQKGDRIMLVDGQPIEAGVGKSLTERVTDKQGAPIKVTVLRGLERVDVEITPSPRKDKAGQLVKDKKTGKVIYYLGIAPSNYVLVDVGVAAATWHALKYPVEQTKLIAAGLYGIIVGTEDADPGGPVRIVEEFQNAFETSFVSGIKLLMTLSVYLGLFNLFPLPALDGGRLVFLGYEMVTRRRANPKIEAMVHMSGIMLLGIVMILVTFKDCKRLIVGS